MIALPLAEASAALPDPNNFQSIGWVLIVVVAIVHGADRCIDFWKKHMREQPTPSTTYVANTKLDDIEKVRTADRNEIKETLREIKESLEKSKAYQAKARKGIYSRLNAQENALYFMAGKEEGRGDSHAARVIRERLEAGHKEMDDEN